MREPDLRITAEDIRRLMATDGFVNSVNGKPVPCSSNEMLLRALEMAAENGCLALVKELIVEGADVCRANDALVAAAENNQVAIVNTLLAAGVPVDSRDRFHNATALMNAAGSGAFEAFQVLLASGADLEARDQNGNTVSYWAKMGFHNPFWDDIPIPAETKLGYERILEILDAASKPPGSSLRP